MAIKIHDGRTNDLYNDLIKCEDIDDIQKERKNNKNKEFIYFSTGELEQELLSIKTLLSFERFIEKNAQAFTNSYVKLIDFIDSYVLIHTSDTGEISGTLNSFLKEHIDNLGGVAGFNTMVSKLRCYGIVPSRTGLIALGIHFGMTADGISTMLELAGMESLCVKDKLESIVIFAVECAIIKNPDIAFSNALLFRQYTKNADMKAKCDAVISRMEMTEYQSDDNTELFEYITNVLFHIDSDITDELLYLLGNK